MHARAVLVQQRQRGVAQINPLARETWVVWPCSVPEVCRRISNPCSASDGANSPRCSPRSPGTCRSRGTSASSPTSCTRSAAVNRRRRLGATYVPLADGVRGVSSLLEDLRQDGHVQRQILGEAIADDKVRQPGVVWIAASNSAAAGNVSNAQRTGQTAAPLGLASMSAASTALF